ncbi:MAG: 3-deoxy-D-manno-octulosonic acid transferase [Inquilinaceae bacterium]
MLYALYRGLTDLAGPAVPWLLARRQKAGKEDPSRRRERLGYAGRPRPDGALVWIHAASVGEALSVRVLIDGLLARRADLHVLLTTGTVTSARLMAERLPDRAWHQYVPLDRVVYVRRFLDHWRPDLVLWVESELWPNLVTEIRERGIPAAMVNARMSVRSFAQWRRVPRTIATLLDAFRLILPWDEAQGQRFRALGAPSVGPAGNLKFSTDPPAADADALAALRDALGDRPVWLAASTHEGEDGPCLDAHKRLTAHLPDLLTILAPRHPARGDAVVALADERGLTVARRSRHQTPGKTTAIYLADTIGDMGLLLRLAPITFIGGSLVAHGGHNPIEAAQLGSAILYGPHMNNFAEIAEALEVHGASVRVTDGASLAAGLDRLLRDPEARRHQTDAALALAARHRGVADTVLAALAPLVAGACGPAPAAAEPP